MRFHRQMLSTYELWQTTLELWAISQGASTWLIDIEAYEPCTIAGIAVRWRIDPLDGFIEATITDGTGELVTRWPSSRRPSPLHANSQAIGLVLRGIPSVGSYGDIMMVDPDVRRVDFPAMG